jgi:hypothetical protein
MWGWQLLDGCQWLDALWTLPRELQGAYCLCHKAAMSDCITDSVSAVLGLASYSIDVMHSAQRLM